MWDEYAKEACQGGHIVVAPRLAQALVAVHFHSLFKGDGHVCTVQKRIEVRQEKKMRSDFGQKHRVKNNILVHRGRHIHSSNMIFLVVHNYGEEKENMD